MASPQTERGFARIANELLLALARTKLGARHLRVLFCIFEQTYGWHRKEWWLSLGLLASRTKISRGNCGTIMKELIAGNYVTESIDTFGHRLLGIQKDYERWSGYLGPIQKAAKHLYPHTGTDDSRRCTGGRVQGVPEDGYTSVPAGGYQVRKIKEEETKKEVVVTRAQETETIPILPTDIMERLEVHLPPLVPPHAVVTFAGFVATHGVENVRAALREAQDHLVKPLGFIKYVRSVLENQQTSGYTWESKQTPRRNRYVAVDITPIPTT